MKSLVFVLVVLVSKNAMQTLDRQTNNVLLLYNHDHVGRSNSDDLHQNYGGTKKQNRHRQSINEDTPVMSQEVHKTRHRHYLKRPSRGKELARYRILSDRYMQVERRKRYSYVAEDGLVHYNVRTIPTPCTGWGVYAPYRCVQCKCVKEPCRKICPNTQTPTVPIPYTPNQLKPSIYAGAGRYWIGPRAGCNCNSRGSELPTCDITTGQCRCKPFYMGRTCDTCLDGFWESTNGCVHCQCDSDGSRSERCNQRSGQCDCKPGVGGLLCDTCLPNYYGFSQIGCKECEPCNSKGHICDPDTGRCVCPPYSHGEYCHICAVNTWGYEPNKGCKQCNCSHTGSSKLQCNITTGECTCKLGYDGISCDRCSHGYYGYPRCRRCNCNIAGTDSYKGNCDNNGICQCDKDGHCPCKTNVSGKRCEECRDGTFGLQSENPDGCTQCFCFGRSSKCSEAGLTWGQIRLNASRTLTTKVNHRHKHKEITQSGKLLVIPEIYGNVTIERQYFESPLYWKLHPAFEGDRVLSYGGYLRFTTETINPIQKLPQHVLNRYPTVQLRGHGRIVLEYYPLLPNLRNLHEVRLHESLWKRIFPKDTHLSPRELLMIALQNLESIYIKATDYSDFEKLVLKDIVLDTAIEVPGNPPPLARGVEICECPRQYNSTSCQNPSIGFFRYYSSTSVNGTILIDTLVGQARPCECNGRSNVCNVETGHCLNCRNHTSGSQCEKCEEGYYGNPMDESGKCEPCPCPSTTQHFASDCRKILRPTLHFVCKCKPGYSGPKCDECSSGYYGQPKKPGGSCKPCNCNVEGRASDECDSETGQCNCKPGVTGLQCTQCIHHRHVLQHYKCAPCDNCTQWLLSDIDWMTNALRQNTIFLEGRVLHPPWEVLKEKERTYDALNNKLIKYAESMKRANKLYTDSSTTALEKRLRKIQRFITKLQNQDVLEKSKAVTEKSNTLLDDIIENKYYIQKLIDTLNNFGKSRVSTNEALHEARKIMRQIEHTASEMKHPDEDVLQKCIRVQETVTSIANFYPNDTQGLDLEIRKLQDRIGDLKRLLADIELVNNEVAMKNKINEIDIAKLNETLNLLFTTKENMLSDLSHTEDLLKASIEQTNDIRNIHQLMEAGDFGNVVEDLEKRISRVTTSDYDKLLYETLQHVLLLEKNASQYVMSFNLSSRDIDIIKASEAYANINKFIDSAKQLALEANRELHNALNTLLPTKKDPLAVNASISNFDSERLGIRIKHLQEKLMDVKLRKDNLTIHVNTVDSNNWENGLKNRYQVQKLLNIRNNVNKQSKESMEDVIKDIFKESNRIKDIHRKIMDLNVTKEYELKRPFQRLLNLTTREKLNELEKKIGSVPTQLKKVFSTNFTLINVIKEHGLSNDAFQNANLSVSEKLIKLKAQIQKARQSVEGMRMSISGFSCSRSYSVKNLQPSLSTILEVTFNYTPNAQGNTSLVYLSTDDNQFLHLFVTNNTLAFTWSLGNYRNIIQSDVKLHSDFYTVYVERLLNHVTMKLRFKGKNIFDKRVEQKERENENVLFNFNPNNLVYVGSSPDTPNGLPGCIKDISLNKQKLGLWNYITSNGNCSSCVRQSELIENSFDFFNGESYFNVSKELQKDSQSPTTFFIQFILRTFDENALLFLAPEEQKGRGYIAISLEEGHIKYQVYYNNKLKPLELVTDKKYNNGEKIYVSVTKFYNRTAKKDIAHLNVAQEKIESETRVNVSSILKLGTVNFYFGGIPKDFDLELYGISKTPLLGGLQEIVGHQSFNLDNNDKNIRKYGIEKRSGELEFKQALFEGSGHLILETIPLHDKFLFLLRPTSSNSFAMQINEEFQIELYDGKLNVIVLEHSMALHSSKSLNLNNYYLIELEIKKNISLKINGKLMDSKLYKDRKKNTKTKIYMGNLPELTKQSFSGLISDITIDNQVILFNKTTVQSFEHVKIGHTNNEIYRTPKNLQESTKVSSSNTTNANPFNIKDMQNTEGCGNSLTYSLDPDAAKFGDKSNSYVVHFLKDLFWKKDYHVGVQFRTLHSDGVLFLALGPKQHFILVEIYDGKVLLKIQGKRKKQILISQKVNDGRWHSTEIFKRKRKLQLVVDGKNNKSAKVPKNNLSRELYIGGIAENVTLPDLIRESFKPFHGCIKGLALNMVSQSLVKDKHYNIGQCFPNIEEGAYFGGDSYSIYKKNFQVDTALELSFDFRTTEQNGILLSVSNSENKPALSLELQNGAIVLSANDGFVTSSVTNNLSNFALCNNKWHNVTTVYSLSEITVTVDGIRKSWVQPDTESLMNELEAPLYVGGLPDSVPVGTLKMKENFKGCMKNFVIHDRKVDWLDMEKNHNVRLDSCPVVT